MKTLSEDVLLIEETLENAKKALMRKGVEVDDSFKLTDVDEKITEIQVGGGSGSNVVYAGEASSLLAEIEFPNSYPTHIIFTDQKAPDSIETVDWSRKKDKSVVKWLDSETDTLYISSQENGVKIATPSVTSYMFNYKTSDSNINNQTQSIDFININTSFTTDMRYTFRNCKAIETLNLINLDTSNVLNMAGLFDQCEKLNDVVLTSFDTYQVTDIGRMFYGCKSLKTIDLSDLDTRNVTDLAYMFYSCTNLTDVNVSMFNTSNVITMCSMFSKCSNLETIDLSNFDITNLNDTSYMFSNCVKLKTIYAQEWCSIKKDVNTSNYMYDGCTKLPNYSAGYQYFNHSKWKENGGYLTNPAEKPTD